MSASGRADGDGTVEVWVRSYANSNHEYHFKAVGFEPYELVDWEIWYVEKNDEDALAYEANKP